MNYYEKYIKWKSLYIHLRETKTLNNQSGGTKFTYLEGKLQSIKEEFLSSFPNDDDISLISCDKFPLEQLDPSIYRSKFIHPEIRGYLSRYKTLLNCKYKLVIKGYNITVNFTIPNKLKQTIDMLPFLKKMYTFLKSYDNYKRAKVKSLTIYYLPTPFKKELPERGKVFTPLHVNSGFSVFNEYLFIFRREEFDKVLIHELIHHIGIDDNIQLRYKIDDSFPFAIEKSNSTILFNETFVEVSANLINIIFESIEGKGDPIKLLNRERDFALSQVAKILKFSEFTSYEQFIKSDSSKLVKYDDTNLFAYYFAKAGILYYLEDYFKLFEKFNKRGFDVSPLYLNRRKDIPKDIYWRIMKFMMVSLTREEFSDKVNENLLENPLDDPNLRMTFLR